MQGQPQNQTHNHEENYHEKSSEYKQQNQNYKVELTIAQALYLTKLLPYGYSLQFQQKIEKRASTVQISKISRNVINKKKSTDTKLLTQIQNELNRLPSNRTKKSTNIKYNIDQIHDIVYAKYQPIYTAQISRRNTYENLDESLKPCVKILNLLKNSKTSWAFRQPVDPIGMGIPHYTQIVKQPMDLSKIQNNLRSGQYATPTQFHADLSKIIRNSYLFNKGNIQFTRVTQQFQQYYFKIIADPNIDQKTGPNPITYMDQSRVQRHIGQSNNISSQQQTLYSHHHHNNSSKNRKKPQRPITQSSISQSQKRELSLNIRKLPRQYMKGVVQIVKKQGQNKIKDQFDLEDLKFQTIRQLQIYVRNKLIEQGNNHGITQKTNTNIDEKRKINPNANDELDESEFQIQSEQDS